MMGRINIGTAGWTIPRQVAARFPAEGTGLERYSARFPVAEINSSFHRPHRLSTWQRWYDSTPAAFRFSVKLPKTITHERRLTDFADPLAEFIEQAEVLGDKLAIVLVQLPPKLEFELARADDLFRQLAARMPAALACEPRHPSWFTTEVDGFLRDRKVARVAADPARCDGAGEPGGWPGLAYWRLHGSPVMYRSSYADRLEHYAGALEAEANAGSDTWCIFDNTASSAAGSDALALMDRLGVT